MNFESFEIRLDILSIQMDDVGTYKCIKSNENQKKISKFSISLKS